MGQPIFYVNGEFVPAEHASLPLTDLGIVRGYGIFDLWRTYDGVPFHQHEHLQRFASSAAQIQLDLPWSEAELDALIRETVARNGLPNASIPDDPGTSHGQEPQLHRRHYGRGRGQAARRG
jgi:branched-chain amino acid aminotransferase